MGPFVSQRRKVNKIFKVGSLYTYGHLSDLQFRNLKRRFVELYKKTEENDEDVKFVVKNLFTVSKGEYLTFIGEEHYKKDNFEGMAFCFLQSNGEKAMLVLKDGTDKKIYSLLRKSLKEVKN
jgi:hypothetical protein